MFVIFYILIGILVSIIYTYFEYRESSYWNDIQSYFEWTFSMSTAICIVVVWPAIVFMILYTWSITIVFTFSIKLLDRLFGGRK